MDCAFGTRSLGIEDKGTFFDADDVERKDRLALCMLSADTEESTSAELDLFLRSFHMKNQKISMIKFPERLRFRS